jgi:hypothetical protein
MLGTLNRSTNDCLLYDKDLPSELFSFFTVYEVPKCNESGVTKQFLTREEAHAKLIARRNEALGVNENLTKLDIFKQFKSMKYSDTKLKEYLLKYDAEFVKLQAELDKQVADATDKCPLIKILQSERYLAIENERTLIAEINKQLK